MAKGWTGLHKTWAGAGGCTLPGAGEAGSLRAGDRGVLATAAAPCWDPPPPTHTLGGSGSGTAAARIMPSMRRSQRAGGPWASDAVSTAVISPGQKATEETDECPTGRTATGWLNSRGAQMHTAPSFPQVARYLQRIISSFTNEIGDAGRTLVSKKEAPPPPEHRRQGSRLPVLSHWQWEAKLVWPQRLARG